MLNPVVPIVEAFRYGFTGSGTWSPMYLAISMGMTAVIMFIGIVIFNKVEKLLWILYKNSEREL